MDKKYDIIIRQTNIISMEAKLPKIQYDYDIGITGKKITAIDKHIEGTAVIEIDGDDTFCLPGFINCHTHINMSIFSNTENGKHLHEWLQKVIWPVEKKITDDDLTTLAEYGVVEQLLNGITTFNDMYFKEDIIYNIANKYNINSFHCKGVMDVGGDEQGKNTLKDSAELAKKIPFDNYFFGIHGLYTSSEKYLNSIKSIYEKNKYPIHMHFCEDESEVEIIKQKHNVKTPGEALTKYFSKVTKPIVLAHGVFLTDEDIKIIKKMKNVSIVHCPISNARLGCGIIELKKLLDNGINVCIGTDGPGSSGNINVLDQLRFSILTQFISNKDSLILTPYDYLKMATINGAKALGIENKTGTIKVGKDADITFFHFRYLDSFPINDPIAAIVHNGTHDIQTVISQGKIVVDNNKCLLMSNTDKLIEKIKDLQKRLFKGIKTK